MKKSDSISELAKAFSKTQQELKQPLKDAANPFFKSTYVPLENVAESITETATKNGLAFSQEPSFDDGMVTVTTLVMHSSGEWIEYAPLKMKPVKNDPQAFGSAITYAKRYALSAIFGITSDKDDDGNEATQPQKPQRQQKATKQSKQYISVDKAKQYEDDIQALINATGKNDGSIMGALLNHVGATMIKNITTDKANEAEAFIAKMKEKAGI
ncbi:Phage-associated recombinase [Streptococcus gallolyticus]|uniref:Phage-associated recombinase n=1 Tax=Streptococcus gallolyticus TaxID=315405 RepID=A0A139MVU7_9STRE|nr:ERF family protein [Streptococcus gallolyticus]KXT67654.1 Phage-associated recombinase [Streptococcus gallolyticus]QBX24982.1 recombinase [Streptococcus phage Javan224]